MSKMLVEYAKSKLYEDHEELVWHTHFLWPAPVSFILVATGPVMSYYIASIFTRVQILQQI